MSDLAARGAALLGGTLHEAAPMGGGSLSQIVHIRLTDGREAVAKTGPAPMVEAAMLWALVEVSTCISHWLVGSSQELL